MTKDDAERLRDLWDWLGALFGLGVFVFIGGEVVSHLMSRRYTLQYEAILKIEEHDREGKLAELSKEAADANARAAQAELAAKQLDTQRRFRTIGDKFGGLLKGKPTGTAEVLYKPDDTEAYFFAFQISKALRDAGWIAYDPNPIPSKGGDWHFKENMPIGLRYGGTTGLALRTRTEPGPYGEHTAVSALRDALSMGMDRSNIMEIFVDPRLPEDDFVIVVNQKSEN